MSEILSQEEIDALLSALTTATEIKTEDKVRAKPRKRIRVYDFKRPNKFSKEQIHTLQAIHENFSRLLATFYSAHLRSVVQINVYSVEQLTYEEFIRSIPNPTIMSIFQMEPLAGSAIMEINPILVFTMIDRLFGGVGEPLDKVRGLTDIERSIVEKVIIRSLDILREAWENIVKFTPRLETIETNPQFTQIVSPSEMVVLISLETKIGGNSGLINLCFPFIVLEPVISKLSVHYWFAGTPRETTAAHLQVLQSRLEKAKVSIAVELGKSQITVRELLDLQKGDVITLNTGVNKPVAIKIGDKVKFYGIPGTVGSKLAVKVIGRAEEGDEDE
ncbi:MAG: flagellar motor switch protein FliM [Eubacteriales bacterium]|nr:flagellar motor switch protein FliM [Eubacteriales bacterium]